LNPLWDTNVQDTEPLVAPEARDLWHVKQL